MMSRVANRAFVGAQVALLAALLFLPRVWTAGWEPTVLATALGWVLVGIGALLGVAAGASLGRNLTPFPVPRRSATLVVVGPYRHARHPIYGGVLLALAGWTLASGSLALAALTFTALAFFDAKRRFEERALRRRFAEYDRYRSVTRVFVPFVF